MKTIKYPICLLTIISCMVLFACKGNNSSSRDQEDSSSEVAETINEENDVSNEQLVIDFITEMYNQQKYEKGTFLEENCSQEMLKKLQDAYEYEGGGYASWEFRSGAQDGPSERHEIIAVTPLDDNWYRYEFYDMGIKGSHDIKVIPIDGQLKIVDLK